KAFSPFPSAKASEEERKRKAEPSGPSVLTLFYVLLFLLTFLLTIAVVVLKFVQVKLPPAVERLWPWRWGILAALNALLLFFLVLQLLLNFTFESNVKEWVDKKEAVKTEGKDSVEKKKADAQRGLYLEHLHRTIWLRLTVLLQLLNVLAAWFVYWM